MCIILKVLEYLEKYPSIQLWLNNSHLNIRVTDLILKFSYLFNYSFQISSQTVVNMENYFDLTTTYGNAFHIPMLLRMTFMNDTEYKNNFISKHQHFVDWSDKVAYSNEPNITAIWIF